MSELVLDDLPATSSPLMSFDVSIIVVSYNTRDLLRQCLLSLIKEAAGFQAVDCGCHGGVGQERGFAEGGHAERAFVEEGFEDHEVGEADVEGGYGLLYEGCHGVVGTGEDDPEGGGGGVVGHGLILVELW